MQVKSHIRISFFILWHVREYRLARTAKGATGRMELKSYQDTVMTSQNICETKLELPVETEILIPDYLPQVFKIVKSFVYPVVLQKQVMAGRLTAEGYLRCIVYYQGDGEEGLCQTEQKIPFTKQVELRETANVAPVIQISGEPEYLNCRAVSGRRVDVRGAYALNITACAQEENEIITALAGGGIEQKTCELAGIANVGIQEKLITAEEDISFEKMPVMILSTRCESEISEVKLLTGKAVVKGTLSTEIVYRAAPGEEFIHEKKQAPFNTVMDVDGASENCKAFVLVEPTGCTITAGPEESPEQNLLSITALVQVRVYREIQQVAVCDAFSTQDEIEMNRGERSMEFVLDEIDSAFELGTSGALPDEHAQILEAWATPLSLDIVEQDAGSALRCRAMLHLLCKNALGELDCYDKICEELLPGIYPEASQNMMVQYELSAQDTTARQTGTETEAHAAVHVKALVTGFRKTDVLQDVRSTGPRERKDGDIALRIYFAQPGEDLFDIAKRYAASPQAIATANQVSDGPLTEACKLLIPSSL